MPVRGPATVDAQGGVSGVAMKLFEVNMEALLDITGYRAVEWVAAAGIDILGYALPMTPYESGKLRESGTVTLEVGSKRMAIAHGSLRGVVEPTGRFNRLNARKIGRWLWLSRCTRPCENLLSSHRENCTFWHCCCRQR